ncbi:MAG: restriction endonuclease subunit S [Nitrospirae bacterium]|nr:restriction endonuclease subunit S [Nitrospirota bacterium]
MSKWSMVSLGRVASPVERPEVPVPGKPYRQVGVRLWGEGAYERELLDGSETKYKTLSRVEADDIVVNKIWARNGSVAVVPDKLAGCYVSGEFPTFKPTAERLEPLWFHWLTKTPTFWEQCDEKSRGTSGKNRIRPERFLEIEIPLPPLPEQRRIVARIESLTEKVQNAQGLRQELFDERDSLVGAVLNRFLGNPYTGERGKLQIADWCKLTDVVTDVADGPHITPRYVDGGVPFITVLNITSGRISFRDHKYITPEDHKLYQKRARADKGDVLISKDGTIGVPCFVDTDREFSFFVSVALVKPKANVLDGEFLTWVLRAPYLQERMKSQSRGDMIRHLVLREIRELTVPLPSIHEQRRIVAYLDGLQAKVDELKQLQAETADELAALLPSILDKAFKGEL